MSRFLMILIVLSLASCGEIFKRPPPVIQKVLIVPEVPEDLRTPVVVEPREVATISDVGNLMTDLVQANDTLNGKVIAVDCILDKAEAKVAGLPEYLC